MQATQSNPKPRPMSDAELREHMEVNEFHGIWVSQRNIDDYRNLAKIPKKK